MNFKKGYPREALVEYIAELSNENKYRIEYMDNHPDSIRFELEHIEIENHDIETVYVAEKDGKIECLFIFDIDDTQVNVMGPFTKSHNIIMMKDLFSFALDNLYPKVTHLEFAINGENAVALLFIEEIGGALYEENYVFVLPRESYEKNSVTKVYDMKDEELQEVKDLFERVFPQYRFNYFPETDVEEHKIYVTHDDKKVVGFVHVVIKEEFNDGLISYLVVDKNYRRQGLGKKLMQAGLNKIFEHAGITEAYLRTEVDDLYSEAFYNSISFEKSIHTKIYRMEIVNV